MSVDFRFYVPLEPGAAAPGLKLIQGSVTLVGGTITEVLSVQDAEGIPDSAPVFVGNTLAGGAPGTVAAVYVKATRTITFLSSEATDASALNWLIFTPRV